MSRRVIEIANPRRYGETHTSLARVLDYCARELGYMLSDGRFQFYASCRVKGSDYEVPDEATWWNGEKGKYLEDRSISMFPPGCVRS